MRTASDVFPFETRTENKVRVITHHLVATGDFETIAVWRSKVLNTARRGSPFQAGLVHQLFVDAWGSATDGNLIDEIAEAADFDELSTSMQI